MYDMGFMPQVNEIIENLPENRQTLMFTATMPAEVERLVRRHMKSPVRVQVGHTAPPARAEQKLHHIEEQDKLPLLLKLLDQSRGRVLVFVRTKHKVEKLTRAVAARKHHVARIHGGREQSQRDTAMSGFREGKIRILVATDIAARGIDVADIEHVINYDFPRCPEDYVHRIGRTARVAASGLATSFVTPIDRPCLRQVEKLIDAKLSDLSAPDEVPQRKRSQNSRGEARSGRRPSPQRHGENRRARTAPTNHTKNTKEASTHRHRTSEDRQQAVA
jgi:ATP-dependent RNA helicase RhlE